MLRKALALLLIFVGILFVRAVLISFCLTEAIQVDRLYLPPPSDYSPPGLDEIHLPTTAESCDSVADPYLTLHQDAWICSSSLEWVGNIANAQDQYRRVKIPSSIIQSFIPFLGEPSQWDLITFGIAGDSWCQPNIIWIKGKDDHKLVCQMTSEKWLLLSGPHGLPHLNAYLNQSEPASWSLQERLHDILSFYGYRGLLAIAPDTDNDVLWGHRGKNTDQLRNQIKMLQSEERFKMAVDHTFVFECDVQTRESYQGDKRRSGLEKWIIKGTLTSVMLDSIIKTAFKSIPFDIFPFTKTFS